MQSGMEMNKGLMLVSSALDAKTQGGSCDMISLTTYQSKFLFFSKLSHLTDNGQTPAVQPESSNTV